MPVRLSIVTPARPLLEADVETVRLPGQVGEFGVLQAHERFLTSLVPGVLEFAEDGEVRRVAVSGGFAEVTGDRVTALAPAAERAADIDRARAGAALERAEEALRNLGELAPERAEHEAALARARARLAASE